MFLQNFILSLEHSWFRLIKYVPRIFGWFLEKNVLPLSDFLPGKKHCVFLWGLARFKKDPLFSSVEVKFICFFKFLFLILRSCIIFWRPFFLAGGLLFVSFASETRIQTLYISWLHSFSRWLYSIFPSSLCRDLLMMLSSIHQASVSDAGGNFIFGKTGCVSSFYSAALTSSELW